MTAEPSFFFYDLETSGQDPRRHRIVQFAGRRTSLSLEPIGDEVNIVVKLADDILPEPMATIITGITPQSTQSGITEAELVNVLQETVLTPGTIMVGYNNVEFDDEYLRYTFYRNFYDPYAWAWKDGRSRWDFMHVVLMTRALRPTGLIWPVGDDGKPVNKLERLAAVNHLEHLKAHDAMSDVIALIGVAGLIRSSQPKLWDYMLANRDKAAVASIIASGSHKPFVHTSLMLGKDHDFTTLAVSVGKGQTETDFCLYDLRFDPTPFLNLSVEDLRERLYSKKAELETKGLTRLPVKGVKTNKCPAVAAASTWTAEVARRLELSIETAEAHAKILFNSDLPAKIMEAMASDRQFTAGDVDGALYDGFIADGEACSAVRAATSNTIATVQPVFSDPRMPELLLRYKGRNFNQQLLDHDRAAWETYRAQRIMADIEPWSNQLQDAYATATPEQQSLLVDLQLWAESIYPSE